MQSILYNVSFFKQYTIYNFLWVWIARCTLKLTDFIPRASALFSRMIAQGGNRATLAKQLKKVFHSYPTVFQEFVLPCGNKY